MKKGLRTVPAGVAVRYVHRGMGQDSTRFSLRPGGAARLSLALVVVLSGLIVGCKANEVPADDGSLDLSPPAEASPTPSPTPEAVDDPYAIPDEIDEEYLSLVMQELERIRVEGLRGIYADQEITDENTTYLRAIFTPDEAERVLQQLTDRGVTRDELRGRNLTSEPRVPAIENLRIVDDGLPHCVFVEFTIDETAFLEPGIEAAEETYLYRTLLPRDQAADPQSPLNVTPWLIGEGVMHPDRERVENAEEYSLCAD